MAAAAASNEMTTRQCVFCNSDFEPGKHPSCSLPRLKRTHTITYRSLKKKLALKIQTWKRHMKRKNIKKKKTTDEITTELVERKRKEFAEERT